MEMNKALEAGLQATAYFLGLTKEEVLLKANQGDEQVQAAVFHFSAAFAAVSTAKVSRIGQTHGLPKISPKQGLTLLLGAA